MTTIRALTTKEIYDLNHCMEAARKPSLGTIIDHTVNFISASGTMALQSASAVNITGGTITGVIISGSLATANYANTAASAINYEIGGGIDTAINLRVSASTLSTHTDATGSGVHGLGTISTQNSNSISASGSFTGTVISASAKFGTGNDYTYFEADGTMGMSGSATVWEDLRFPATAINPAGAPGPMGFDTSRIGFTAAAGQTQTIAVVAQLPHSYKLGVYNLSTCALDAYHY